MKSGLFSAKFHRPLSAPLQRTKIQVESYQGVMEAPGFGIKFVCITAKRIFPLVGERTCLGFKFDQELNIGMEELP